MSRGRARGVVALTVLLIVRRTGALPWRSPGALTYSGRNLVQELAVNTVDYHTGGEPFRIVADSPVPIPGDCVADRRARAIADPAVDGLRQLLCFEPRGHADMYGGFITPPDDAGADFGVLFWHKDGFSTACGHGTIALGVWAVDSGRVVPDPGGITDVTIDVPSGRVVARVRTRAGQVTGVNFVNVPSYALAAGIETQTSRGRVSVGIGYGGAIYAHVRAADAGLAVEPGNVNELIAMGREVKGALNETRYAQHPRDPRLNGIYGTILFDELGETCARRPPPAQRDHLRRRPAGPLAVWVRLRIEGGGPRRQRRPEAGKEPGARLDRGVPVRLYRSGPDNRRWLQRRHPRRDRHGLQVRFQPVHRRSPDPLVPGFVLR